MKKKYEGNMHIFCVQIGKSHGKSGTRAKREKIDRGLKENHFEIAIAINNRLYTCLVVQKTTKFIHLMQERVCGFRLQTFAVLREHKFMHKRKKKTIYHGNLVTLNKTGIHIKGIIR